MRRIYRPNMASRGAFTQTASETAPTDPSPQRPLSAGQPLRLPTRQCAPHLPDCAQVPRRPAPAPLLPPHPRQANVHSEILSFPPVAPVLWRVAVRPALVFAMLFAHPPPILSCSGA